MTTDEIIDQLGVLCLELEKITQENPDDHKAGFFWDILIRVLEDAADLDMSDDWE